MNNLLLGLAIIGAVAIASLADSVSMLWIKGENHFSIYFFLLFLLGPLVFICFALVSGKTGLAIASGVVNSLLVVSTITVGLFLFGEWNKISVAQYVGIGFALFGVVLMLFFPKTIS